jgi:hypothetical protein
MTTSSSQSSGDPILVSVIAINEFDSPRQPGSQISSSNSWPFSRIASLTQVESSHDLPPNYLEATGHQHEPPQFESIFPS